jgi:hypothetical protein
VRKEKPRQSQRTRDFIFSPLFELAWMHHFTSISNCIFLSFYFLQMFLVIIKPYKRASSMSNQQGARGFNFLHFLWTNMNAWMIWQWQAWAFFKNYLFAIFLVNISHQKTPIVVTTILMWRVVLAKGVNGYEVLQSINLAFTIELHWPTKWINTTPMPSNFKKDLKIFIWILRVLKPKTI